MADAVSLMLTGDVMTGRGIDQVLPHPSPPVLYESYVQSALDYVRLAESAHGKIARPVSFPYIWGDALELMHDEAVPLIVNLETAVTRSSLHWPKAINYRMHPENAPCLTAAGIDCCVLANNHVLDWGEAGLIETIDALKVSGIATAGAGRDHDEAGAPAVLNVANGTRVLVFAAARPSSGVPREWAAGAARPGVCFVGESDPSGASRLAARIARSKRQGDVVVCSVHWGPNWGHDVDPSDRRLAHALIEAGVDVVHGHSSHHPKAMEIHSGRLILYGCGDFLNDYEGIGQQGPYRSDLAVLYRLKVEAEGGALVSLEMIPFLIRKFSLRRAPPRDIEQLRQELDRECARFGVSIAAGRTGSLELVPSRGG